MVVADSLRGSANRWRRSGRPTTGLVFGGSVEDAKSGAESDHRIAIFFVSPSSPSSCQSADPGEELIRVDLESAGILNLDLSGPGPGAVDAQLTPRTEECAASELPSP